MSETLKNFINTLKNNPEHAFDFIANNHWKMDDEELAYITKELLYSIYCNVSEAEHNAILNYTAEQLEEWYEE